MDVQTPVTGLRRVGGRDKNQRNPCNSRLVFQKLPQLVERPTVGPPTLCLAARLLIDSSPYPYQVFQSNRAVGSFCPRDNSFGDAMIDPRFCYATLTQLKASLLARQPLQ